MDTLAGPTNSFRGKSCNESKPSVQKVQTLSYSKQSPKLVCEASLMNTNNKPTVDLDEFCLTATDLRQRGWTDNLISKFLEEPDNWSLIKGPVWGNHTNQRAWFYTRILEIEKSSQFMAMLKKSLLRRKYDLNTMSDFLKSTNIEDEMFVDKIEALMMKNESLLPSECRSQLVELVLFRKMRKLGIIPTQSLQAAWRKRRR